MMMSARDAQFAEYQKTFPSDSMLEMYFDEDFHLYTLRNGGSVSFHEEIRYTYDACIRARVMVMMRAADAFGGPIDTIILFEKGLCAPGLREYLAEHGLYFSGLYEFELYTEFRTQFERMPFYADPWWEWFMSGDTIGARLAPGANLHGGNERKVTLGELLSKFDE